MYSVSVLCVWQSSPGGALIPGGPHLSYFVQLPSGRVLRWEQGFFTAGLCRAL